MIGLTHRSLAVSKAALEGAHDYILMLLLNDLWCGGEYPEGSLTASRILGLAELEQSSQQLRPRDTCFALAAVVWLVRTEFVPSSVCWRASSATASPTLLRTELSGSLLRHWSSFARIASRSAGLRVKKRSAVWLEGVFRGLEDWRLKMTAANVRV